MLARTALLLCLLSSAACGADDGSTLGDADASALADGGGLDDGGAAPADAGAPASDGGGLDDGGGVDDGGAAPDGGTADGGSEDGGAGDAGTEDGGVTPAGGCEALDACCSRLPRIEQRVCLRMVRRGDDALCDQQLAELTGAGYCGPVDGGPADAGGSDPVACETLDDCCDEFSRGGRLTCQQTAARGDLAACQSLLDDARAMGVCLP